MNKSIWIISLLLAGSVIGLGAEEFTTWEESARAASDLVQQASVEGRPLVTDARAYNTRSRIIHKENDRIEFPLQLTENEWKSMLDKEEYRIIRRAGTEHPFTGELNDNKERGTYFSRATGQPLFSSDDKFDSGTGWPSFTRPITPDALAYIGDSSLFSRRIEVVDSLSGAHLGHVFDDGPAPMMQRYCINSASLVFVPEGEEPPELMLPAE